MKNILKFFCVASVIAIGFTAIGSGVSEAATKKGKTEVKDTDGGRTASSYRKPIKLSGIGTPHRRGSRLHKESGGMQPESGGLKSAPLQ
ncbi:MAG TPA: hypothetical protein VJV58_02910 [Bradyrhizobium sp.]|uniref:hypothetical protein n=1 Tax=Bradyrhizobium sp. TaxID=376 RepID=UPI002B477ACE|nr:hypothetical protein [Bradyrhizobium sp.]HKO69861.1 hypothetical protein [Bradyrhizobium sp.]